MALEIKQSLKLAQQLVITPQLQQAIKLLQLSRLELQNLIQHELLENPILEETPEEAASKEEEEVSITEPVALLHDQHDKDQKTPEVGSKDGEMKEPSNFDWENYMGNYNAAESGGGESRDFSDEPPPYENLAPTGTSLQDHLLWQIHMAAFPLDEIEVAEELIGEIDDDGYMKSSLPDLAQKLGVSVFQIESTLSRIQEMDPPGVGARDLKECLKIQIKPFDQREKTLLESLIDHHLEDLERKNYPAILKNMKITMERLRELSHIISTLEPKPGRPFGSERPQYIIPDVFVEKVGTEYIVFLNDDGLPKLQVSNFYRNALYQKEMPSNAKEYIQDKLRSALWLIRSIHQRQRTLYRVTTSIVKFQKDFLENGVSALRPMVLRDIAEDINMHESTISRVTTNKYVQTPRGLFELKFFFNARVPAGNGDGLTSEAVKEEIRKLVTGEDPKKPLSDQIITDLLNKSNIQIARRTVAKYRELMGILPASRRRQVL
ncbi:MAG TPA: RNA polymerase factor sigma-54 [bacterium]|nr:RNA polymerase factor sigma-54 [bacterium]